MATIDTNMSLVMIDPNEPLELYDGTIIKGRLEWFLYALCCLDYGNLPTPLSRIEEWVNALITNELPNMEPQSRAEEFFKAILTGDTSNLPTPQSRSEVLLDKLARGENDFTNVEKIQSRYEFLLAYLIKNGGGIGNIDYVLYKFQKEDETLYNTKERPVKSAILKGQTLVSLVTGGNEQKQVGKGSDTLAKYNFVRPLDHTKTHTLFFEVSGFVGEYSFIVSLTGGYNGSATINKGGTYKIRISPSSNNDGKMKSLWFYWESTKWSDNNQAFINNIVLIEGDHTQENIPYFEGMQSVKMPVLCSTGNNLLNPNILERGYLVDGVPSSSGYQEYFRSSQMINVSLLVGKKLYFKSKYDGEERLGNRIVFYDSNEKYLSTSVDSGVVPDNAKFVKVYSKATENPVNFEKVECCLSTINTYEPYKTNILSAPEDLELRGIGNVKDTLDLTTGEVVQNIYEFTLDGSQNIDNDGDLLYYYLPFGVHNNRSNSDKLPSITVGQILDGLTGIAPQNRGNSSRFYIKVNGITTKEEMKNFFLNNPTTIQCIPETPTIKTVDLTITDQGGATIPKLKTFDKITHVNVSATDILPGVEMEVATTIGEDLSGTLYSTMEDIETKQEALKESNNAQTESIDLTMMGTTEIYESLL